MYFWVILSDFELEMVSGIQYEQETTFLMNDKYVGKDIELHGNASEVILNGPPLLNNAFCSLELKKNSEKTVKKPFFMLKYLSSLIHILNRRELQNPMKRDSIGSSKDRRHRLDDVLDPLSTRGEKEKDNFKNRRDKNNLKRNFVDMLGENDKNKTLSGESITVRAVDPTISPNATITKSEAKTTSTGATFTTILSEKTETIKPTADLFSRPRATRSHDNTYMILGISAIVILIAVVIVFLVIYGVRRSLKRQEMLEDMLYENEMNTHAKLMAAASTPVSEKMSSTTPSSVSISAPILDRQYSNDLFLKNGIHSDFNRTYSLRSSEKHDDRNPGDSSMRYYNRSQLTSVRPPEQHAEYPSHYNFSGQPMRSFSLSSRPREHSGIYYSPNVASNYDSSFQMDQQRLPCHNNDINGTGFGKAAVKQPRSITSVYFSKDQNKGHPISAQTRTKYPDPYGFNRSFGQENPHNYQTELTMQPNAFSSNYMNFCQTPKSGSYIGSVSSDNPDIQFSDLSNTVSSPLSVYQDSTTSSQQDTSFTTDHTTPKSFRSKESIKNEFSSIDSNTRKSICKVTNKRLLSQNYMRTPSINASIDIWAEKKKKLLDLTNNLNGSVNNRPHIDTSRRKEYNVNKN